MRQLIDRFGRHHDYLRISVTDKCNLRCVYCMPSSGITWKKKVELLSNEELVKLASLFAQLGINKVRLTGGEPLVRPDIEELIYQLASIPGIHTLAMTTNGTLLFDKAESLRKKGISALNISLDTFCGERFLKLTKRDNLKDVLNGLESALAAGFPSLKLNMVVIRGVNDDEVLDFVRFACAHPINVRFIEFMPFIGNEWDGTKVVSFEKLKEEIERHFTLTLIRSAPSSVAKDYAIAGGAGTVSFITSMSDSFCNSCNRLRLTADGSIKSCLFFPPEISLRDALRRRASDLELVNLIYEALSLKPEAHPPAEEIAASENRAMIAIGG